MKRLFLFLVFISQPLMTFAHSQNESSLSVISDTNDKWRIQMLIHQADSIADTKPQDALGSVVQAMEIAAMLNDDLILAECNVKLGDIHFFR